MLTIATLYTDEKSQRRQLYAIRFSFQRIECLFQLHWYIYVFKYFVLNSFIGCQGMGLSGNSSIGSHKSTSLEINYLFNI